MFRTLTPTELTAWMAYGPVNYIYLHTHTGGSLEEQLVDLLIHDHFMEICKNVNDLIVLYTHMTWSIQPSMFIFKFSVASILKVCYYRLQCVCYPFH